MKLDWCGRTKQKNIYVISTLKRPVPLEHHLYADGKIYMVVDSAKKFHTLGYKQAQDAINKPKKDTPANRGNTASSRGGRGGGRGQNKGGGKVVPAPSKSGAPKSFGVTDRNLYVHMIGMLRKMNLLPCIIFTFSKRKCEEYANTLVNIDLTSGSREKSEIHLFVERSLGRLKGMDRELPQVLRSRELLSRGIAVHHSGQLPIIKEMVEILFTKGLVKILFATETFAMGVNAPAKAVVFSGIRKHDGESFRELLPGGLSSY
jgi:antiviral helicase SKI2